MSWFFPLILFLVSGGAFAIILLRLRSWKKQEIKEAKDATFKEVQDDIRLRDVVLANDIRERVADVPDRLPPVETTGAPTEKRRGRRGTL